MIEINSPHPHPKPPRPPKPAPTVEFVIIISTWVQERPNGARGPAREVLVRRRVEFRGTLAGAKASISGQTFYVAKIYERGSLVATVRGSQPNPHPHPHS